MTSDFEHLLENFLQGELTPEELKVFLAGTEDQDNLEVLRRVLAEKLHQKAYSGLSGSADIDRMFRQMQEKAKMQEQNEAEIIPIRSTRKYLQFTKVAAAVMLLIGITAYFWSRYTPSSPLAQKDKKSELKKDVMPGGNRAVLTLSNGAKIVLDSASNGMLAQQGNSSVVKLSNGQLSYQQNGGASREILYNTMSTPRGGQYKLILPDGTQVWLNASSSVTYPTAFAGKERKVDVVGEAYFEVVQNAEMPFKVTANGVAVNVLGTHFNVNAYGDEATTKITLLEGAVRITKGTATTLLKPGQQAQVSRSNEIKFNDGVEVEEAVAWKNGLFWFNGVDLPGIMRQLSRWYDIDVAYEGEIPHRHFSGHVFRHLNLSEVLKILELSHVHFRIEGKKLIVTP
ncbi:FecR domain-containing protein [Chitinophaga sp. MM2321]|uniref:FecR family protein n=1 Tax=Chitinophaga sp. MM2321 TaxID=3137178 RepID=UPI0032D56A4B